MEYFSVIWQKKRLISLITMITLLLTSFTNYGATTKGGSCVKAAEVIPISSAAQLQLIGNDGAYPLNGDYILTTDIDLAGISFTPIGGIKGERGAVTGTNVFSGTFDGKGYLISNMTINVSSAITSTETAQVGLFANIASNNASDYAVVKNIAFSDVNMKAEITNGFTAAGSLAGEVNGYATIDNIAVLSGNVIVNGTNASDVIGAGGVIGEIRTSDTSIGNGNISITHIYNGSSLYVGSSTSINYTGGIIGRIAKSNCKTVDQCINVGSTSFKGDLGWGISGFDSTATNTCISNSYFLFDTGRASGSTELTEAEMKTAVLPQGLSADSWYATEGMYPLLNLCKNPKTEGYLGLMAVAPTFADGENASAVMSDFTLPTSVSDIPITWTSNNIDVISIDGGNAHVAGVMSPIQIVLTASTSTGLTRMYTITVASNIKAVFLQNYAKPGQALSVNITNAPTDLVCDYSWKVGNVAVNTNSSSYEPTTSDLEKNITVTVTAKNYDATWDLSMYCSELPVVYMNTQDGTTITDKNNYVNANFKIQGNDEFQDATTYYNGLAEAKGRGNSTWDYAVANGLKKPYKIKLDKKTNVLGMGKNKHWVLLANMIDHTNMRNQLVYEFSNDIGMDVYMQSTNVVLILNNSYEGIYQLGEAKRIDDTRVDIFDWESLGEDIAAEIADKEGLTAGLDAFEDYMKENMGWVTTGTVTYNGVTYKISDYYVGVIPEYTGGFLLDMDFRLNDSKFISKWRTTYSQPMFFDTPEYAKTNDTMMTFTKNYVQAFEDSLHTSDYYTTYDGKKTHYSELFDVDSLVENWMIVEYTMNWDGMKNSTLMYKDLEGPAKMGPAWDFDWCWGNINMYSMTAPWLLTGWHTTAESFVEQRPQQQEQWNRYLIGDPYFAVKVYELWNKIRPTVIEDMIKTGGKIDQYETKYKTASLANDTKWSSTYNKYSGFGTTNGAVVRKTSETYADAIDTMEYFLNTRVDWFDQQFTSPEALLSSWGKYKSSDQIKIDTLDTTSTTDATKITASSTATNVSKIAFYMNGILADTVSVSGGAATAVIADSMLVQTVGDLNTVQVRAVDASGNLISSNGNVVTTFATFTKESTTTDLSGSVTISGNTAVGAKLSAFVTDTNNSGSLSYQWFADGVIIDGATASLYILTEAEIGKVITVQVKSSIEIGTLTSAATLQITPKVIQTDHLILNQVYGGGHAGDTPISHSFIEIYNPTDKTIDLSEYSISYLSNRTGKDGSTGGNYVTCTLTGSLPAKHSYLIRCAEETTTTTFRYQVVGDMEWNQVIDNKQYQVLLMKASTQIDGVAVTEADVEGTTFADGAVSKQKSLRRKGFVDTNINQDDFEAIAYNTVTEAQVVEYAPRNIASGSWGLPDEQPDALTGIVSISGNTTVDAILHATVTDTNNSGTLIYQWYADGAIIDGATSGNYELTEVETGKAITVQVTSTIETGTLMSTATTQITPKVIQTEHLILNQVYGGGHAGDTPMSHSFIEIYNPTNKAIDLSEYTISYLSNRSGKDGSTGGNYVTTTLTGSLPAKSSYLIRCASETTTTTFRYQVVGDMEWEQVIDNKQYQVLLMKGSTQIDGVAVTEADVEGTSFADGAVSKQKSLRRKGFVDTNNNQDDFEAIVYNTVTDEQVLEYSPRNLASGTWGLPVEQPEPDTLTGTVSIQGTAKVLETLTAQVENSNNTGTLTYQWMAEGTKITGATGKTYLLTLAEVGKKITVIVGSTIETGTITSAQTGTIISAQTGTVTPLPTVIPDKTIYADQVLLNKTNVVVGKGKTVQLSASVLPANTTDATITYSSLDAQIASVDQNGGITAKSKGITTITAKTSNGKTANCQITVAEVTLNVSKAKLQVGKTTSAIKIMSKYPVSDSVLRWSSSKSGIATVTSSGKVKAKKVGTTTIKVEMKSGAFASYKLTVTKSAVKTTKLTLSTTKIAMKQGKKYKIKLTRNPITANDAITFTVSDKKKMKVSKTGVIKALKKGNAKITIKTASGKKAILKVTIK